MNSAEETPQEYLDEASREAGLLGWQHAQSSGNVVRANATIAGRSIIAHAATLHKLAQLEEENAKMARERDEANTFLDNAVSKAPEPLRQLGEYLAGLLDEVQWPAAERYLNAAVKSLADMEAENAKWKQIYESAVRGRQDFRNAYRELLPIERAAQSLSDYYRTPGVRVDSNEFMALVDAVDVAVTRGGGTSKVVRARRDFALPTPPEGEGLC